MPTAKPVEIALLGAGARGELNLGTLAKRHAGKIRFVAVAEPDDERRERFVRGFGIDADRAFRDWRELVERPQLAEALLNTLPCNMHYESTMGALKAGYHVLLEKPMAHTAAECVKLTRTAREAERILMISLQSRYNRIYSRVRDLLDGGRIGRLMNIDCAENVGYWHFALSYVRGIHSRSSAGQSFMLGKAIHDVDLIAWFAGSPATRVSSFGKLTFFNERNAPEGAPERCLDGCPVQDECPFSAVTQYLDPGKPDIPASLLTGMSWGALRDFVTNPRFRTTASVIVRDISRESRLKALRETPYGKCVFRSENDVVDHQTASIEFENDVMASFSLNAFSLAWERTCNLHGTEGEIRSADFSGRLELRSYQPGCVKRNRIRYHGILHGGGDEALLLAFAEAVGNERPGEALVSADRCLESHMICFAAEEARASGAVVDMAEFRGRAEKDALAPGE